MKIRVREEALETIAACVRHLQRKTLPEDRGVIDGWLGLVEEVEELAAKVSKEMLVYVPEAVADSFVA